MNRNNNIRALASAQKSLSRSRQLVQRSPERFFHRNTPAAVSSWSIEPTYYSYTSPFRLVEAVSPIERFLHRERMIAERMFNDKRIGHPPQHHYELVDNDEKFQLTLQVPGVKEGDININLRDGQLTVHGERVSESESSRFTSRFTQSFSLDPSVDMDGFTATLKNGVLVVSAPKDMAKMEEDTVRKIPITPLGDDSNKADENENVTLENDSPQNHEEGEDKETEDPSTASKNE